MSSDVLEVIACSVADAIAAQRGGGSQIGPVNNGNVGELWLVRAESCSGLILEAELATDFTNLYL